MLQQFLEGKKILRILNCCSTHENLDAPLQKEYEDFQGVGTDLLGTILVGFVGANA